MKNYPTESVTIAASFSSITAVIRTNDKLRFHGDRQLAGRIARTVDASQFAGAGGTGPRLVGASVALHVYPATTQKAWR